jgi:HlyD family secretion protein
MKLEVHGLGRLTSGHTAALNVAETQMQNVWQGEPAMIAFPNRKETFRGKVAVVHPEVASGKVTVDVVLDDPLPPGISLQETVDGTITTGALTNVVYVGRPVFGHPNSQVMLFRIEPGGRSAKKVPVQLGAASVNLIEIRSGLQPGDRVILSDMSQYDGVAEIVLR